MFKASTAAVHTTDKTVLTTPVDRMSNWAQGSSIWPVQFGWPAARSK
jgi:NADH:ubiquinone oxidoreductase subunit B-like Fe-S oxidoreductase